MFLFAVVGLITCLLKVLCLGVILLQGLCNFYLLVCIGSLGVVVAKCRCRLLVVGFRTFCGMVG